MGRLHDWGAAARRSPVFWVAAAVVVVGLVAGGVALATSGTAPPPPAPATSNRAVAFGDSVPYGHGLANPYLTPQVGLPPRAISQGPSSLAYPSLVAQDLGLTMTVRPTNCRLQGDQLAISGAVADPADNTAPDGQCPLPRQPARNLEDELAAARLAEHPAHLVLLQDGADDIDFSACLVYELARILGAGVGLGTPCLGANGTPTPQLTRQLANVRTSLARAIEDIAPHTVRLALLDYYQPLPAPSQIASGTAASGMHTNLVCTGLKANANGAYAAAQVVLADLNRAITGAVADARAHDVRNVRLVDLSTVMAGHGLCTTDPWVFSGESLPDATLAADAGHILAAKACAETDVLHRATSCDALTTAATRVERSLEDYVWRTAHPTAAGQRAIAVVVENRLRGSG